MFSGSDKPGRIQSTSDSLRSTVAQRDLRRVGRVADRAERVRVELADAILAAHESGETVRDIAPHARLSSSRVHDLLKEARARVATSDGAEVVSAILGVSVFVCQIVAAIFGPMGCPMNHGSV